MLPRKRIVTATVWFGSRIVPIGLCAALPYLQAMHWPISVWSGCNITPEIIPFAIISWMVGTPMCDKWTWSSSMVLQFASWAALFSSSLLFLPCLLSQGPFPMLTITIFLSWDPSHSPYMPSNPYAVPYTTTRQGTLFAYLFLVMDNYSFSRFSHICCMLLLLILLSMAFHDLPFLLSRMFYLVPSYSFAYSADLLSSI